MNAFTKSSFYVLMALFYFSMSLSISSIAQVCIGNFLLTSQTDIIDFQANHGPYDEISGSLIIDGNDFITNNENLCNCSTLTPLLDTVDDDAPGSGPGIAGIPDVGDEVNIFNNQPGCNFVMEILAGSGPLTWYADCFDSCPENPLELYGMIGEHFVSVDQNTGDATEIGTICGFTDIRELTWHAGLGILLGITDAFNDPKLVCIDRNTGQASLIGPIDIGNLDIRIMEAMAFNPVDGLLYGAVDKSPPPNFASRRLVTIDPATGDATQIGLITGTLQDEADDIFFINGIAYVMDGNGGTANNFYELDLSTGIATLVSNSDFISIQHMAYNPESEALFVTDLDGDRLLGTMDVLTGLGSVIGPSHTAAEFGGEHMVSIAIAPCPDGVPSCEIPEIDVQGNNISIVNGHMTPDLNDHTDFGCAVFGLTTINRTFIIENIGTTELELTGSPIIEITGTHASDFSVNSIPTTPIVSNGAFTSFTIRFAPGGSGIRTAEVSIASNDCNEELYTFTIQGAGIGNSACIPPPSGLVGWWPGDGNAIDVEGVNDGMLENGVSFEEGAVDQAFSFDGTNDHLVLPPTRDFYNSIYGFTWDAWVMLSSIDVSNNILTVADEEPCEDIILGMGERFTPTHPLYVPPNHVWANVDRLGGCGNNLLFSGLVPGGIQVNTWYFITLTVDYPNNIARLYLNGNEIANISLSGSPLSRDMPVTIGMFRDEAPGRPPESLFPGLIDEVEIFERPLSSLEIQDIFLAGSAGKCKCPNITITLNSTDESCPGDNDGTLSISLTGGNGPYDFSIDGGATYFSGSIPFIFSNLQPGSYNVLVRDANNCESDIHVVLINASPSVIEPIVETITVPVDPVQVNTTIDISGEYSDIDDDNVHEASWDWGDGNTSGGIIDQNANTISGDHIYTTPGVYIIRLTIQDGCDNEGQSSATDFVVVYDPAAGFVTGGGWIESPPGAYIADPALTGQANFGFVSKYLPGQSQPDGNTQFQFKAGNFKFKSTGYDWLVIAGPNAKFKGTGKVNNYGEYGFMLTGRDGQLSGGGQPDKFRIKIWDKNNNDEVVYDNQLGDSNGGNATDQIEGGSITIHNNNGSRLAGPGEENGFKLEQNFPNPFIPETVIPFYLPFDSKVILKVIDLLGREVIVLRDEMLPGGEHTVYFHAGGLKSGIYYCTMRANDFKAVRKMIILKD